ncbi:hypothetical protein GCM10010415_15650 [Streptomyces atrovirens]
MAASDEVPAFFAASNWALTTASCFLACVWASVMPFFALANWAVSGYDRLSVPLWPDGLIRNFCEDAFLQSHSRASVLLVNELRSRHLPVVRLCRGAVARASPFHDCPLDL